MGGGREGRGERGREGVGDSRKLRRLYIFGGSLRQSIFFYRAWNVSIGMNALCPPSTRKGKKRERRLTLHSLVGANLLDSSGRHVVAVLLLFVLVGVDAEESCSCLRNRAASQW